MRRFVLAALGAAALMVPPATAEHGVVTVEIDPVLRATADKIQVTGTIDCPDGLRWHFLFLRAGTAGPPSAGGTTTASGRCTGEPTRFTVGVKRTGEGTDPFTTGPGGVRFEVATGIGRSVEDSYIQEPSIPVQVEVH